jgi:signal peptidase I
VPKKRIEDFTETDVYGNVRRVARFEETLPNGVVYTTLDLRKNGYLDNTKIYKVPAGNYFMMGDNRDNSSDSRVLNDVGYVPFENLVGRAEVLFFSVNNTARLWEIWRWPSAIRWDRLFNPVK